MRIVISLVLLALLGGCASAQVDTQASSGALLLTKEARRNILVSLDASQQAKDDEGWQSLRSALHSNLDRKAFESLYSLTFVPGRPRMAAPGVLVDIDVTTFRYRSQWPRRLVGPATGEAWVDARVAYYDLQTGRLLASRTYRTGSEAWGAFFSSMSERQVDALTAQIIDEIRLAEQPIPAT